jgi:hypothetical protein
MATEDLGRLLRVPGKLVKDPSNLGTTFPYGGTQLGAVEDVVVRPRRSSLEITGEEFGPEVLDVLNLGEAWTLGCLLRGFDADALALAFLSTAAGTSGQKVVNYPGSFRAGTLASASSCVLLFAPDDPLLHPAVLFRRALVRLDQSAALTKAIRDEGVLALIANAIRPADGDNAVSWGLLEDLSL